MDPAIRGIYSYEAAFDAKDAEGLMLANKGDDIMTDHDPGDQSIKAKLSSLSVSDIAEAAGGKGVVAPGLFRIGGSGTVAGRAVTADCDEGSLVAIWAAIEDAEADAMLCVTGPGISAYMGDLLATDLQNRGFVGAVIDGFVRDRAVLSKMTLSFFARGTFPMALRKPEPGRPMVPVHIGGVTISPGDWVVADDDGVIVIAPWEVDAVLARAEQNAETEQRIRARIKGGTKVLDAVREVLGKK